MSGVNIAAFSETEHLGPTLFTEDLNLSPILDINEHYYLINSP